MTTQLKDSLAMNLAVVVGVVEYYGLMEEIVGLDYYRYKRFVLLNVAGMM